MGDELLLQMQIANNEIMDPEEEEEYLKTLKKN